MRIIYRMRGKNHLALYQFFFQRSRCFWSVQKPGPNQDPVVVWGAEPGLITGFALGTHVRKPLCPSHYQTRTRLVNNRFCALNTC